MKDEKLIEKIRKGLLSLEDKADACHDKKEKLVENYTIKLLDFQVADFSAPELTLKKQLNSLK
ncbi:MAG TPA: hypothetical protein VK487_01300 [Candidatus Bathyarchaeia archaeon]|nr:hypothetical protein [Candidatus Bathyarchaeia archaeon]